MKNVTPEMEEILKNFGLSKKEVAVYFAILELGRGTVTQIARAANINRTSGYDILATLSVDGLVRISGKEPKQEYVAESPDTLLAMLEKKLEEAQARVAAAKNFVPTLKSI